MITHLDDDAAIRLVNAIINQTELDFIKADSMITRLKDKTDRDSAERLRSAKRMKADCVVFLRSEYFIALTGTDGTQMLDRLNGSKKSKRTYNKREGWLRE